MDDTTEPERAANSDDRPTDPTQPINPMPADPWSTPESAAQPTTPIPPVPPPTQPTQPYGDPYASGYAGTVWGAGGPPVTQVPPVPDPWLPPGAAFPPQDVLTGTGTATSGGRGRRPGLTLIAVALAAGLIGAGGASAVVLATRTGNDGSSSTAFSAGPASSTATTSVDRSRPAGTVAAVAADVLPSVVSILETSGSSAGEGSGIVLDTEGHILTNNHVVAEVASGGTLTVTFQDGTSAKAAIVGRDPLTDIAVIKVTGQTGLKPAHLGSSASLQVGDQVIAIGSPLGLSGTVTEGIVSAIGRPVVTDQQSDAEQAAISAIQTDAAINPGNSGGALVDGDGAVIGINSAIATVASNSFGGSSQSGNIGVGFAIPIDQAKRVASQIIAGQKVTHARLGTRIAQSNSELTTIGATLGEVAAGSAADKAGLKSGDVITKVNDALVQGGDGLVASIRSFAPGTQVDITYVRAGQTHTVSVTLGSDATSS
jgi:putative serine protease PepD